MAVINETLRLTDAFSATMRRITASTQGQVSAMRSLNGTQSSLGSQLGGVYNRQRQVTEETQRTARASGNWLSTIKNIAIALGVVSGIKLFVGGADQMSQMDAKLRSIAGSEEAALRLQEQIYQSAQRSRAAYNDTANLVARVGTNAREAFNNTGELVQFAENLNKSFVIAGATQQEQAAATLQLTQALASGVLRGEELNSVFEAAPNIIRTIADYLDVPISQIREMASEGQITAEVVKNAMLAATDDINESFSDMPMTLAQAFQVGKNAIQQSMRDAMGDWSKFIASDKGQAILSKIIGTMQVLAEVGVNALTALGNAALWCYDNFDYIAPLIIAIAAALVASGLATAAAWAATNWPILAVAAALGIIIFIARQAGVSWQQMASIFGNVMGFMYAIAYNVVAFIWNLFASFAQFFANVFNDPINTILRRFASMADSILSTIEKLASAIDAVFGSNLAGAVSGFRSKLSSMASEAFGEDAVQIKRMETLNGLETAAQWGNMFGNMAGKLENANFSLDSIANSLSGFDASAIPTVNGAGGLGDVGSVGSVGSVKSIEGDVKLSDEDMKIYRDLAERRYMNNVELKTLAPQISVTVGSGANAQNLKPKDIANAVAKVLAAESESHTAVSHA